jgi:exodeoxyribonuclease VII large subunit
MDTLTQGSLFSELKKKIKEQENETTNETTRVPQKEPLTVSKLSLLLKKHVEGTFSSVYLRGEVSGLKRHQSGHVYFAIKDQEAVLDAVCWKGTSSRSLLSDGLDAIFRGRITTYPGRSKYQMIVESVEIAGEGALLKLLYERRDRFKKEGLFEQKKPIPKIPKCIGIITSPTGAVIRDILHRLSERFPCHVLVWPVLVQGQGASDQIAKAVLGFAQLKENRPDVLIVARGGGSIEDLWAFNEENVVRAVANVALNSIPIISAIGHETDTTLVDFASSLRAPTPTAAAELCTPVGLQLLSQLQTSQARLIFILGRFLHVHQTHLSGLIRGLLDPKHYLENLMIRFDDWYERLLKAPLRFIEKEQVNLLLCIKRLRFPDQLLKMGHERCEQLNLRLNRALQIYLRRLSDLTEQFQFCLNQTSPNKPLERGYCWVGSPSHVMKSAKDLKHYLSQGEEGELNVLQLKFYDATVSVKAKAIE